MCSFCFFKIIDMHLFKEIKFFFLFLIIVEVKSVLHAQGIYSFSQSNYSGVSGVIMNPANVYGACKFDLTMGASAGYINNWVGISRSFLFVDFDMDSILKRRTTRFIEGNSSRNFVVTGRVIMPSFIVKLNSKSSIGFLWNVRHYMNLQSIEDEFSKVLYNHLNYPPHSRSFDKIWASSQMWAEYGIVYGREIFDTYKDNLSFGLNLKFLQGIQSFYAYTDNFQYTLLNDSAMDIQTHVYYGHTKNFSINPFSAGYSMNSKASFGMDVGVNYIIKSEKYRNEIVDYVLKLSASIVDIGSIKYKRDVGNDFSVKVQNWNVRNLQFNSNQLIKDLNDTLQKRFVFANNSDSYRFYLPRALNLQVDWRLSEKLFLNLMGRLPMRPDKAIAFSKENAFFSIAPRIESIKDFAVSVPIHYYPIYKDVKSSKYSAGLVLQLGWIAVGTNHLTDLIFKEYMSGFDFYLLLKFSSFKKEPRVYDKDKDGVEDRKDACPEIAGEINLMGCPDKDKDGIADKDDVCPDEVGLPQMNGCPDKDADGVMDKEDGCPEIAGLKELKGCPDRDADSIADRDDKCPDIKGVREWGGCPVPKIDGNVLLTENVNDVVGRIKLYLLKGNCEKVDSTLTNEEGYFKFDLKDTTEEYFVRVDERDERSKGKARFFMSKEKQIIRVSKNFPCDRFMFTNLPYEKYPFIDLKRDGLLHISGNFLAVVNNTTEGIKNKKLIIRNTNGDIVDTIRTNEFGAFVFKYLDYDQNYLITFAEDDLNLPEGTKILLTNKNGKEIKSFIYMPKERFKYELLSYDKVTLKDLEIEDENLNITLKAYLKDMHFNPLRNVKIQITDEDKPIQEVQTDSIGLFIVNNIRFKKGISFIISNQQLDSSVSKLNVILITDAKNRVIKRLVRGLGGEFKLRLLDVEKTTLVEYQINDPWLNVLKLKNQNIKDTIKIREKINYALNSYKPDAAGYRVLDKVVQIMKDNQKLVMTISSHTDSRGNDKHNMQLSEKRAKFAFEYIVSKGIEVSRLKWKGYGESQLLNECGNNVKCSEEKHAENRRTEFDISVEEIKDNNENNN